MDTEIAIIGGGVVGLALAYDLSKDHDVFLLEKNKRFGRETSAHNSGVIHNNIYYPKDSWKAKLCSLGRKRLYSFCEHNSVPYKKEGKVIVAVRPEEIPSLEMYLQHGTDAGAEGLRMISREELREREPYVDGVAALHSPETGVFDVAEFMLRLRALAEKQGAILRKNTKVVGVEERNSSVVLKTTQGDLETRFVVNAAGLYADDVASFFGIQEKIYPWRGEYYTLKESRGFLVNGLVYTIAPKVGLGVHFTKTIHGEVHIGPNANPVLRKDDYVSNRSPIEEFLESARKLIPSLQEDDLKIGDAGIRATLIPFDQPGFRDYKIFRKGNCVHLMGVESPGLTASLGFSDVARELLSLK